MKQTRCTNFTNLFWHETLHVSDSSSAHHQEFIHCTLSNSIRIQVCRQLSSRIWSCLKAVYKPVWHILLLSVQWINSWWWAEELSETCRVSCQNKFVKLVHPVGFIIKKICYDARSHERKKPYVLSLVWPYIVALERPCVVAHSPVSILTLKEFLKSTKLSQ